MANFERFLETSTESEAIRDALRTFDAYRKATTLRMLKYDIFFKTFRNLSPKEMKEFYSIVNEHYDVRIRKIKWMDYNSFIFSHFKHPLL